MSKTIKKSLILILLAFLAFAILFAGVSGTKTASASTEADFSFVGASVRLKSPDGFRFGAKISSSLYEKVVDNEGNDIEGSRVGMIIVPETYVNEYKAVADTFKGGYHDYFTNEKDGKMLDYVFTAYSIVTKDGEYFLNATIIDMLFDNYNLKYVAIGYLLSGEEYQYLAESEARSFSSVVDAALDDPFVSDPDQGADEEQVARLNEYDKRAYFNAKGVTKADDAIESYLFDGEYYEELESIPVPVTYAVNHNYGGTTETETIDAKNGDIISYRENMKALDEYAVYTVDKTAAELYGKATWENDGEYVQTIDYTLAIPVNGEGLEKGVVHYRDIAGNEVTGESTTEKMTGMTSPLGNTVYKLTPSVSGLYIKALGISPEKASSLGYKTLTMYIMLDTELKTVNPVAYAYDVAPAASINSQTDVKNAVDGIRLYNVDGVRMSSVSLNQWSILEFNLDGCGTDAKDGYMDRIYAGLRLNADTYVYIADVSFSNSEFSSIDDFLTVDGSNGQAQLTTYYNNGYSGIINTTTSIRVSQGTYFGSDNVIKFDFAVGSRTAALQIQGVSPTWLSENGIKKIVYEYYYDTATKGSSNPTIFSFISSTSNTKTFAISPHSQTSTYVKVNESVQKATANAWNKVEIDVSSLYPWEGSAYDGLNLKLYEEVGYSLYIRNFAFSTEAF